MKKLIPWNKGKTLSEEHVRNLSLSHKGKVNLGEDNAMWKGDDVGRDALHEWIRNHKPKPLVCDRCETNPPIDLCNISPKYNPLTYTRNLACWRWYCRRCHMWSDNRIKNLKRGWLGLKHSETSKKKISEAHKGRKVGPDAALKGWETRRKRQEMSIVA